MHIAIAGNIGCGKTTLTKMLAKHYGWTPMFEPVDNNPYLKDYYADMARWAFNLQIYFLEKRFKDIVQIALVRDDTTVVQDRSIFEDAYIFARNLRYTGRMSERDYETYIELFELMMGMVHYPDLMIYIRSGIPNLVNQIAKRGREFERTMGIDFLMGLNELYEEWIATYPERLIIVDGDQTKFEGNPEAFSTITDKIDRVLFGIFPEEK